MNNLVASNDNSIEPRGAIGKQKFGIIFWQKRGFYKLYSNRRFRSIISIVNQNFSPTMIQNIGSSYYLQFDNDDKKTIFLTLKKKFFRSLIYGEVHTAYTDPDFHIFALNVVDYISNEIGGKFFVDDATGYLEHRSVEKLKEYIDNLEIIIPESPDLLREAIIRKTN